MKIKIVFLISAMNALSYLCCGNCCENCYGDCWDCLEEDFGKKDENIKEKFSLEEKENTEEEAKNFVNKNWLEKKNPNLKLYKKTELGGDKKIKVTKYTNGEIKVENFNPKENTQKWALFEIVYKKGKEKEKMVYLYCSDIESILGVNCGIFREKDILLDISVLACDTVEMKDMSCMFYLCSSLQEIKFTNNFYTSKVEQMQGMFCLCPNLKKIKFPDIFDTSNVTNMACMFSRCSNLKNLDLSIFDTSNVTNMVFMFLECNNLENLNLSNFNTSKVTSMYAMFSNCSNLKKIKFPDIFDTSNVKNMQQMFSNCSSLETLDLSNFNTSNVTNMNCMFESCSSLENLDLSKFDTSSVTDMTQMFINCNKLNKVTVSKEEDTKNKILTQLNEKGANWKESKDNDKFILIKNQN